MILEKVPVYEVTLQGPDNEGYMGIYIFEGGQFRFFQARYLGEHLTHKVDEEEWLDCADNLGFDLQVFLWSRLKEEYDERRARREKKGHGRKPPPKGL